MSWRNTAESFGIVSRLLHWITAMLVVYLLALGLIMTELPRNPLLGKVYWLHKSVGICVLVLTATRLLWWIGNKRPAILGNVAWEKLLAQVVHALLYITLIGMPVSGWVMSSAKNFPVSFFGLFTLPNLVAPDKELGEFLETVHEVLAWALMGALGLHVAGVIKHTVINKDGTLRRMLLGKTVLLALIFAAVPAQAQTAKKWDVVSSDSAITFEARQMAAPFEGKFRNFTAAINFDPQQLDQSAVSVEVDLSSADTQNEERDEDLAKPEWFNVGKFPKATFVSKAFRQLRADPYEFEVDGTLTIKGISKDITLPFTFDELTPHSAKMHGELSLNRMDFGLGAEGDWADPTVVAPDVKVTIRISAVRSAD